MKRLALALAAAVLGAGCYDHPCAPFATITWDFHTADGATGVSCANAGVQRVDAWVNDGYVASFGCGLTSGTVPLVQGPNLVTVEGIDALGRIAYRDEFSTTASSCGAQGRLDSHPAEGQVNLLYSAASPPPCAGGPCYVWFSVFDDIAGQPAATVDPTTVPTAFPYASPLVIKLPVGPYTADFVDVASGGNRELFSCTTPGFNVLAGTGVTQSVPVDASNAPAPIVLKASCP
jgi:hypothetical protein